MSVEKHFTHDYITSHTMKSYHHTIVFYIRESYYDAIESNRECFYLGMHNVHAFSRVLINHAYVSKLLQ